MGWYYRVGPPVADYMRECLQLRAMVRLGLRPLLMLSQLLVEQDDLPRSERD